MTALGVLCCFALFVCLTLLAAFFLPSHLSFKNMYTETNNKKALHSEFPWSIILIGMLILQLCNNENKRRSKRIQQSIFYRIQVIEIPDDVLLFSSGVTQMIIL